MTTPLLSSASTSATWWSLHLRNSLFIYL